jgi:hypothetical protein
MKTKRKISGYFFRVKNIETGNIDTRTFEDLTEEQQDEILNGRSVEWLKSMVKGLAGVINIIGDQFDIYGYEEE